MEASATATAFAANPVGSAGTELCSTLNPCIGTTFDDVVVPHLDAAHRLARWLVGNEHDAEDVVQEASLRAFRYFRTFSGGNSRAWFLRIVRNTSYGWHSQGKHPPTDVFDEEQHSGARLAMTPETLLLHAADARLIEQVLRDLPHRSRELLVLREHHELSYQELADVMGIPIGTVMSRLSRARQTFRRALNARLKPPDRD
ncbi:MAG TPA: sigma-70 family RNA polymerase sigma factor [Vicinamibacterales bacterium]|nr:sigma-70 family RNA polymerase sigma factor [Vicinamibacterales bacterium]